MNEPSKPLIIEEPLPSNDFRMTPGAPPAPPLEDEVTLTLPVNPMRGSWYTAIVRGMEIETYDIIDALGLNFYVGTVFKYLWRSGRKTDNPLEDALKARRTLDRYIEILEAVAAEARR